MTDYEKQRDRRRPPVVSVRDVRVAYGWTLPQLADSIRETTGFKVSPEHLNNIELGIRGGSAELLAAWAQTLSVSQVMGDWVPRAAPSRSAAA